ncbi:MAG: hypothetical protein ACLRT4_17425 [Thomasclavelia sp.]
MGLVLLALQSIKKDFIKSLFYFLTFVLTTVFIFLFFNLTLNPDTKINLGGQDQTIITPIAVLVILVAMLCVFMVNDFYVVAKSKDISIILVSGASVYQVGFYLLIQSLILLSLAILTGFMISYFLVPIVNQFFLVTVSSVDTIYFISERTYVATAIILLFEIGWCTYLNMGYCYRTNINTMLKASVKIEDYGFKIKQRSHLFYLLAFMIPLIIFPFLNQAKDYFIFSIIGAIGVYGIVKQIVPKLITYLQADWGLEDRHWLIVLGNLKKDLQQVRYLVILVMLSAIILMCSILYTLNDPLVSTIVLFAYFSVMILLAITTIFKLGMELKKRQRSFKNLTYLGYELKDLKKIITLEMIIFYSLIMIIPLLYQVVIITRLTYLGLLNGLLIMMILMIMIVPMLICMIINIIMYYQIL